MANDKNKATPEKEELLTKETEVVANETATDSVQDFSVKTDEIQAKAQLYSADPEELEALRKEVTQLRAKLATAEGAPAKVTEGLKFDFEGVSKKFKDNAPKSIRIDGVVMTQEEIVKNDDVLLQLVGGNSGLIENISE